MTARIKGNVLTVDGVRTQLMPQEVTILWAVMARKRVTYLDLIKMLYPHPDDEALTCISVINVRLCALRKKLNPGGWHIINPHSKPLELVRID